MAQYQMSLLNVPINQNAPVKCSQSILISASPEKVWSILTNINDWSRWQSDISQSKLTDPLQPQSTFTWKTGGARILSTLHTVENFQGFGWTGKTFGLFAIHNWTLQAEVHGTKVTVDESMEGLLAALFKKTFNKNLETGMSKWLELLKKECEK